MIDIFVDARERDFISFIGNLDEVSVVHLFVSDYLIRDDDGAVLVERKTFRDFVFSFRNGRLWAQLVKMLRTEVFEGVPIVRRTLVIEGVNESENLHDESSKLNASVIGAELECIFSYHTPIFFVEGRREMETFLRILVKKETENENAKDLRRAGTGSVSRRACRSRTKDAIS